MFITGTYIGIASTLFSAFVCWLCFVWRRRFPVATFTWCGTFALVAFLWTAMITFAESRLSSHDSVRRTFDAWRASGSLSPDTPFDTFHGLINARNSSMIISTVIFSFIVTVAAGLKAMSTFGREAHNKRQNAQSP